ncbi:hypothetical protein BFJ70_g2685 [Fusarium oxysporum]|nr:hypothetical protein BFJ70_g2685 [Fusarium oxysporum]
MKHDIRDLYDINGPHADIVAAILEGRPPKFRSDDAQPGFDCLIVVLRRIYSHVMLGTPLDWLAASEKENPVLRLAWHTFGDEEEEFEDAVRLRQDVLDALPSKGINPGASFEELCNSSLMNKTFWSQDEFRITDVLYCMETLQEVDGSPDEIADASLLELDRSQNPGLLLQEVVDKSFGVITKKGKQVMCRPNVAGVVRLLYQPDTDDMQRLDINGLRSFSLPLWQQDMDVDDACFYEVGRTEYCLLAVVKLNDGKHQGDKVRTYGIQGSNIVAEQEPREIVDHGWSLKFAGRYMLFYGPQTMENPGDPTRFPEITGPVVSDEDAELLKGVGEHLKGLMLSIQNPKPPTPPVQPAPRAAVTGQSSEVFDGQTSTQSHSHAEPEMSHPDSSGPKRRGPQDSQEETTHKSKRSRRRAPKDSSRNHAHNDSERPRASSSKPHESERRRDMRRSPPRP